MTTVTFLRHGPTKENVEKRIQGQQPGTLLIPETERFLTAAIPVLRENNIDVVACSDQSRGLATRDILMTFLMNPDIKTVVTPLLRERCLGSFEGKLWADVPDSFSEQHFQPDFDFRPFGGENSDDVRNRIKNLLQMFAQEYSNRHICCVTHAGWMRQLIVIAGEAGALSEQWRDRTVLAEATLHENGSLEKLSPSPIEADFDIYGDD